MPLGQVARLLAKAVFLISISTAAQSISRVPIHVVDPSDASIPQAEIQIGKNPDSLGPPLFSDEQGVFTANLSPGVYYVQASAQGFSRQIRKIDILSTSEANTSVKMVLNVGSYSGPMVRSFTASEPELPLPSPSLKDQPPQCINHLFQLNTGIPVFFPSSEAVRYGVSTPSVHMFDARPNWLYVWVNNETARDIDLPSCSLSQRIAILSDSQLKIVERSNVQEKASTDKDCSVDITVRIPAHACIVVTKLDLAHMYRLRPGLYTAVEHTEGTRSVQATTGQRGLKFQVVRTQEFTSGH